MEYSIDNLIGMLNLGTIIADGNDTDMVKIPKGAALELILYLEDLKIMMTVEA